MGCAASKDVMGISEESRKAFEKMPADMKKRFLWQKCTESEDARGWHGSFLKIVEMMVDDLKRVAQHPGDQMPPECPHGKPSESEQEKKMLHIQGSVACFEWKPVGKAAEKYSGIYAKGSKNIIGRFSYGNGPWWDEIENVPGFGLKFLRTGAPSAHIIGMNNLLGVELNYFGNDLSSHMGEVNADSDEIPAGVKVLVAKFRSTFPDQSRMKMSSGDLAYWDPETGKDLDPKDVKFPFRLQFHPPKEVKEVFENSERVKKAREEKDDMILSYHLQEYEEGTTIYQVYAQEHATEDPTAPQPELEHIADLVMTTKFQTSKFGDRSLFFRHAFIHEDYPRKEGLQKQVEDLEKKENEMKTQWRPTNVPYE